MAVSASGALALELIRDRASFNALETEWNALFERAGKPHQVFQTFNWCWHWCNHFLDDAGKGRVTLTIVTGRRDGRLTMIWPLVVERQGGLNQISWLGEPVSQYGDVIVEDRSETETDLFAAWDLIKREIAPDVARLRKVRGDAAVQPVLQRTGAIATEKLAAPYLNLASAQTFDDYEQRYTTRARRNRKRLARRLEECGRIEFLRLRSGAAARELVRTALNLKQAWLVSRGLVSPALADPRTLHFFEAAAEGTERPVGCVVSALKSNGEAAALEIAFGCKGRLALHISVYNLAYEKAGVGVILVEKGLRDTFAEGFHTYDLLAPGADYKLDWADDVMAVCDWAIPMSLAGQAYARLYLGLIRPRAKAAITKLPPALRRMVASSYAAMMVM